MNGFQPFAQPWWVNLLIVVPCAMYGFWRKKGIRLPWRQILALTAFALAFGFVEAAVVVYIRGSVGLLPKLNSGTLADFQRLLLSQPPRDVQLPHVLLTIEVLREAATMAMLVSVAWLAASRARERWAAFLWAFAVWDITYYAGLWATLRWPGSLKDLDVLFLIPRPWIAQVWYPLLVSWLTLLAVALAKANTANAGDFSQAAREAGTSTL